jgi:hypothetical protein
MVDNGGVRIASTFLAFWTVRRPHLACWLPRRGLRNSPV